MNRNKISRPLHHLRLFTRIHAKNKHESIQMLDVSKDGKETYILEVEDDSIEDVKDITKQLEKLKKKLSKFKT